MLVAPARRSAVIARLRRAAMICSIGSTTAETAETAVAAELAGRGWSWRQIGRALAVDHSTAYGWVRDAGLLPRVEEALAARRTQTQGEPS